MSGIRKDTAKSWVVLIGVTFTVFFAFGVIKSFGVLLPQLTEQLDSDTWIIGSCVSLMMAWGYTVGLSTHALVMKFGPCIVAVGCGILSSAGLVVCAFAPNIVVFFVGILLAGFLLMQEIVMLGVVPQYFDKYYQVAVSIYCCGTAFGITIMPLMTQILLSVYGWNGTLLLIAGVSLHAIPFGALVYSKQPQDTLDLEQSSEDLHKSEMKPLLNEQTTNTDDEADSGKNLKIFLNHILTLLANKSFWAQILVPGFVYVYVFNGWLIYIVSFACSNGASLKESSIIASCGGIGILVIRISLPYLNKVMTYRHIMYSSSCLGALSLALTTIFRSVAGMSMVSVLFGVAMGALGAEVYIVSKDVAPEDQYYNVLAVLHLISGVGSIASGVITGLIYDMTQSFTLSFAILAVVSSLAAISLGLEELSS